MRFQYDAAKAAANLAKHGVVTVGLGSAGELLVVAWTERDDECRVISARRPTRKERKQYEG